MGELAGRPVLVIGATRGIGLAIAEAVHAAGARLGLTGREASRAQATAARLGDDVRAYALDVRDRAAIEAVLERFRAEAGGLYGLVYCAGVSPVFTAAEKIAPAVWDEVLAVNLTGAFLAARAFGRLAEGEGSLVLVGSILSLKGGARLAAYTAAKAGLWGLTRALALDWAPRGIRVNLLAPGWVETEMTAGLRRHEGLRQSILSSVPQGRMAQPAEVARVARFLLDPANQYLTGAAYPIDGGATAT
jgi:NAD(P)-dependent dehydrogenase (short-subunit alcohol dehydrogenase family)